MVPTDVAARAVSHHPDLEDVSISTNAPENHAQGTTNVPTSQDHSDAHVCQVSSDSPSSESVWISTNVLETHAVGTQCVPTQLDHTDVHASPALPWSEANARISTSAPEGESAQLTPNATTHSAHTSVDATLDSK